MHNYHNNAAFNSFTSDDVLHCADMSDIECDMKCFPLAKSQLLATSRPVIHMSSETSKTLSSLHYQMENWEQHIEQKLFFFHLPSHRHHLSHSNPVQYCTEQLTRSISVSTNVSHFSAHCVDVTNCTPEASSQNDGIDWDMLGTNNPPSTSFTTRIPDIF